MERVLIFLNVIYIIVLVFSLSLVLEDPDLSNLIALIGTFFWLTFSILAIIIKLFYDLLNDLTLKRR